MRARRPVLLVALLLAPAAVAAQQVPPPGGRGPFIAVLGGLAVPYGDVANSGPAVEDLVERKVPLGLELGYRFNRRVWGALLFELAPGSAASALCVGDASCSASNFRIGVGALLRLAPGARADPWLGAGVAVEVLNAEGQNAAAGAPYEWSWFGIELPFVSAGVDFPIGDRLSFGPWASATLARFTSESARPSGGDTVSGTVRGRTRHGWVGGGLKATLRL